MNDAVRNSIKTLTRTFYDYQRERMSLDGRLGRKKNGEIKKGIPIRDESLLIVLQERREYVYTMELEIAKELAEEVHKHPLWKQFLKDVKGVGVNIAAVIISEIDIYEAKYPSSLWCFAGMAPGKDRKKKGEKCPYNQFLKKILLGVLGPSFLLHDSPYREFYDNMKHRKESSNWGVVAKKPTDKKRPKAKHQHRDANRYMVKMFLKDLYIAWKELEGLEVSESYQEKYLGHKHVG